MPTGAVGATDNYPELSSYTPQVEENTESAVVGEYTARDPDGDPGTWLAITSTGPDASAFELTDTEADETRTLQFKADALSQRLADYRLRLSLSTGEGHGVGAGLDRNRR